jgi:hypothetical protein
LEILRPTGTYETFSFDSDGEPSHSWITEWDNTEKHHVKLHIDLDHMTDSDSDLLEHEDADNAGEFPVTMRFAHYRTPIEDGDDPMYSEPFTVTFREQTLAEKCDLSVLSVTTTTGKQEYEVNKENPTRPTFVGTDASSAIADCVVTQTLQIKSSDEWVDYDPDAASDFPFISDYDDSTKGASIGFDYPAPASDMTAYATEDEVSHWTIEMRYYTVIDQANPTDSGSFSDEF